jgi:hypothetical protein
MKADPIGSLEYLVTQGDNVKEVHTNGDGANRHADGKSKKCARAE